MSTFAIDKMDHIDYGHADWAARARAKGYSETRIYNVCADVQCMTVGLVPAESGLRSVVADLEKVLIGLKDARPDNWTTVMNANGDLMAVPILSALVQGYSELSKLEERT